jgi:hypothetical protein
MVQPMSAPPPLLSPSRPAPRGLAAVTVLFGVLAAAVLGRFVFSMWEPPFDGSIDYDEVVALGGAYWPMNLYLGGPAYALSFAVTAPGPQSSSRRVDPVETR